MNSFIFSFKNIKVILFQFCAMFLIYNLYIGINQPVILSYQNQWQQNYAAAQGFIYDKKSKNVIVGSSLAARIQKKALVVGFSNLSFSGGSVLTGLEIIKRSDFVPKKIFVEINTIFREQDIKMLDSLFYPIWYKVKNYFPALREKNQPLNLGLTELKSVYGKTHEEHMKETRNQRVYETALKLQKAEHSVEQKDYLNKLEQLKLLLSYFETKKSEIVFFEMPVEPVLTQSKSMQHIRRVLKRAFPSKKVITSKQNYNTSDGLHLLYKDAFAFTKEFNKLID
ncbi:MAG: hypothetical protein KC646_06180 [Candidatus Cloacimonetes bacterium]|nr:hypothetical protein [Candidatus Cloacimonadota bacterium]